MSRSYDVETFSQAVTDDFNWRVKEISDVKEVVILSAPHYSEVARKAALALTYAHWEGHVHLVAEAYLKYIALRKRTFASLVPSFQAVHITSKIKEWQNQKDSIALRLKIIDAVHTLDSQQFRGVPSGAVNTAGNLNFDRFVGICQVMSLDAGTIVSDPDYLDEAIVGARNRIAHGASITVTDEALQRATQFVLGIMRSFRTEVENSVVLKRYERA